MKEYVFKIGEYDSNLRIEVPEISFNEDSNISELKAAVLGLSFLIRRI